MDSSLQIDNPPKLYGKGGIWEVLLQDVNKFSAFECLNVKIMSTEDPKLDKGVCYIDAAQLY